MSNLKRRASDLASCCGVLHATRSLWLAVCECYPLDQQLGRRPGVVHAERGSCFPFSSPSWGNARSVQRRPRPNRSRCRKGHATVTPDA
jgi:hypothetical protein